MSIVGGEPLPSHPGPSWTRFVLISDTHSRTNFQVPDGDVLVHAGDLSSWGKLSQLEATIEWLCSLKHPKKIVIAGNHDFCLDIDYISRSWCGAELTEEDNHKAIKLFFSDDAIAAGIVYLQHESLDLELSNGRTWKIFGSPCSPSYGSGAFQYEDHKAKELWKEIQDSTEILITHTPAFEILDRTRRGVLAGCEALSERLTELKDLRLFVFGHIHEAADSTTFTIGNNEIVAVNAAIIRSSDPIYVVDLHN